MRYHIMFSSKGDNRSVYIASSYRNENGQSRKNIVRRCGNLKKLLATDPKALEKIEAEVRSLNEKAAGEDIKKRLLDNETIEADIIRAAKDGIMLKGEKPCLRGLGMIVLDRLWNELNLPYKLSYLKKECDVQFDFEEYIRQKMERSPGKTNRDYANQRHWQSHLRSQLVRRWEEVEQYKYPQYQLHKERSSYCQNPEGHGINVVATLEKYGFEVGWCKEDESHEFVGFPKYMYHVMIFGQELPQIDQA